MLELWKLETSTARVLNASSKFITYEHIKFLIYSVHISRVGLSLGKRNTQTHIYTHQRLRTKAFPEYNTTAILIILWANTKHISEACAVSLNWKLSTNVRAKLYTFKVVPYNSIGSALNYVAKFNGRSRPCSWNFSYDKIFQR